MFQEIDHRPFCRAKGAHDNTLCTVRVLLARHRDYAFMSRGPSKNESERVRMALLNSTAQSFYSECLKSLRIAVPDDASRVEIARDDASGRRVTRDAVGREKCVWPVDDIRAKG